jgi:hypothetical protein
MAESDLSSFFNRCHRRFTILGVFGAISVYFTQLSVDSRWQRLGVVSSLSVFLLVAISIQNDVSPESSDKNPFDFLIISQFQKRNLLLFYVAFWAVVVSITAIILNYSGTILFLVQFVFTMLGVGFGRWWTIRPLPETSYTVGEDKEFMIYASYVLKGSIQLLTVGLGALILLWQLGNLPISQLLEFQVASLGLAITVGVATGFVVAGLLYLIFPVILTPFHFWYQYASDETIEEIGRMLNEEWYEDQSSE